MTSCVFCNQPLPPDRTRTAFDPWLGRLWRVCPSCRRWNVVPLEHRWETLEELEREARDCGRSLLRTPNLDLVEAGPRQLIRVGRAPRPELAGWRYGGTALDASPPGLLARFRRLLVGLPTSPLGYDGGYGPMLGDRSLGERWFASPFLDDAPTLTAAFLHVPLAAACPLCGGPLAVAPWAFQRLRLTRDASGIMVAAECGLCAGEVGVPVADARPALRLGLSIVNRRLTLTPLVERAAVTLDAAGHPTGLLDSIAAEALTVGELPPVERLAIGMAMDEESEAELLEREWREAEELAAIIDGELTQPARFEEFRRRVLAGQ